MDADRAYNQMNRPFGAVDVSANLKGVVPKAATQKIMVALAEKGDLVQKTYGTHIVTHICCIEGDDIRPIGKTTFFVVNQANLEDMPSEKLAALEAEVKRIDEENKSLGAEVKSTGTRMSAQYSYRRYGHLPRLPPRASKAEEHAYR